MNRTGAYISILFLFMIFAILNACGPSFEQIMEKNNREFEEQRRKSAEEQQQIMNSWLGHNFNELIASWGPPTQIMDDGSGGKIYIYSINVQVGGPGSTTTYNNPYAFGPTMSFGGPTMTANISRHRMFWINSSGLIYYWSIK